MIPDSDGYDRLPTLAEVSRRLADGSNSQIWMLYERFRSCKVSHPDTSYQLNEMQQYSETKLRIYIIDSGI
jgi:hypothetical protein